MKLSEYIAALCNALESKNPEGRAIAMNLLAEHQAYREVASHALKSLFLGGNQFLLDDLFYERQTCLAAYQNSLKQQAEWAYENDKPKKAVKPKRVIQSAPKKGGIAKKKIEAVVKKVKEDAAKEG